MKKSNKVSVFYVLCSFVLFASLIFGGCYGIYLSVGLNFVRSSVSNITEGVKGEAQNVSYGGSVNFQPSMTGVIILSIVLIVLAIFDIVSIIKQIVLFKQFKMIKDSKIEQKIEKKTKSKGAVVFFAIVVDLLSLAAGVAGIFINARCFTSGNFVWIMYAVDALVSLFAVVSIVLLIIKLKQVKKNNDNKDNKNLSVKEENKQTGISSKDVKLLDMNVIKDIDDLENKLLKLKYLKTTKLISPEEYQKLREKFFIKEESDKNEEESQNQ